MTTYFFSLDITTKRLTPFTRKPMSDLGLSEPYDLEVWLASASGGEKLFDRKILWLSRQDRPSDGQRSDLIGVDTLGNLLVAELKRGSLGEDGVAQALAYAAEYSRKNAGELAAQYFSHSEKEGATQLIVKARSVDEASSHLSTHVGAGKEVNESQILLLVAEDFTAGALAICDYLNNSSGEASFSIECWRYGVFLESATTESHYFSLEQVLPPPNVRAAIDEKREASKALKRARDPVRMDFMRKLVQYLQQGDVAASRTKGQVYECQVRREEWGEETKAWLSIHLESPRLILPDELRLDADLPPGIVKGLNWNKLQTLEFQDIASANAEFTAEFGDRLAAVAKLLKKQT